MVVITRARRVAVADVVREGSQLGVWSCSAAVYRVRVPHVVTFGTHEVLIILRGISIF